MAAKNSNDEWTLQSSTKAKAKPSGVSSSLSAGSKLNGQVEFDGNAHIEGEVRGEIYSRGELVIAEGAAVEAAIVGETVKIFGRVRGDIKASKLIELNAGASIKGNLFCERIVMKDGVVFEGFCAMSPESQVAQKKQGTLDEKGKVVNITATPSGPVSE